MCPVTPLYQLLYYTLYDTSTLYRAKLPLRVMKVPDFFQGQEETAPEGAFSVTETQGI